MADHKIRKDGRIALALTREEIVRTLEVMDTYAAVVKSVYATAVVVRHPSRVRDDTQTHLVRSMVGRSMEGPVMEELRSALLSLDLVESLCGAFGQDGE